MQRLVELLQSVQNGAAVVQRLDMMRLQIERAIAAGQRFFTAAQFVERICAIGEGIGVVRP